VSDLDEAGGEAVLCCMRDERARMSRRPGERTAMRPFEYVRAVDAAAAVALVSADPRLSTSRVARPSSISF
jgi:hypothetical protein